MRVTDRLDNLFTHLYFGVQSLRNGVDRSDIRLAEDLLESGGAGLDEHVRSRLIHVHGAPNAAIDWLEHQPLVDRTDLREAMQAELEATSKRRVETRRTSGSTGAPFQFVKDKRMTAMMDAVMWAVYGWHGIRPGQKHARFWGMPRQYLPRLRKRSMDLLLHRRRLDAFDLSPRSAQHFFVRLRSFQPEYIHAYPNLLLEFVEHCRDAGMDGRELGVRTVVCGGELLPPTSREAIADFFGSRIVNEYGCSESGLISIECEYGRPHVLPVAVYPQLVGAVETDDGSQSGEVVITDLYGTIMPLIRYQLHDRAKIVHEPNCQCGRELAELSPVIGRVDSFIQTPNKGRVYDAILAYSVPSDVHRFRAYQIDAHQLFVEVVVSSAASPGQVLRELESRWQRELGSGMTVTAVAVEDIPTMASGKLAYFVPENQVPPSVRVRATC